MRTTVTIPDDLARDARELAQGGPLSELIQTALQDRVEGLRTARLAQALEEGYRSEAENPSLDPAWNEAEGP